MTKLNSLEKYIHKRYISLIKKDKIFASLLDDINDSNTVYIFGGWIRDCIVAHFYKRKFSWEDIDMVVDGIIIEENLPPFLKSNLGGYRVNISNKKHADFWNLNDTYAFRKGYMAPSIDNLTKSTVFTVNSVVYDTKNLKLIEFKATKDILDGVIRFNYKKYLNAFPELQVFRIYNYKMKYNFKVDNDVMKFLKAYKKRTPLKKFFSLILKHKNWLTLTDAESIYLFIEQL